MEHFLVTEDWYDTAQKALFYDLEELIEGFEKDSSKISVIYGYLSDMGLIDYDIEKEVLYDRYIDDED